RAVAEPRAPGLHHRPLRRAVRISVAIVGITEAAAAGRLDHHHVTAAELHLRGSAQHLQSPIVPFDPLAAGRTGRTAFEPEGWDVAARAHQGRHHGLECAYLSNGATAAVPSTLSAGPLAHTEFLQS